MKEQQGRDITREEAEAMYEEKARIFHTMPDAPIFDGVKALMEKITEAGLTINIVTGSAQRQLIDRLTHDFGEFLTTEHITTAFDVKHGKPAPDPYLTGLRKAGGLKPWEGIVIENAPLGVKAGSSANSFTVLKQERIFCINISLNFVTIGSNSSKHNLGLRSLFRQSDTYNMVQRV